MGCRPVRRSEIAPSAEVAAAPEVASSAEVAAAAEVPASAAVSPVPAAVAAVIAPRETGAEQRAAQQRPGAPTGRQQTGTAATDCGSQ